MTANKKHAITVKNGKVQFEDLYKFNQHLAAYEGRKAWLTIGGRKNNRSNNQNAYYWGVVLDMLGKYLGYFPDEIHEVLKQKFLPKKSLVFKSEEIIIAESTTTLDTQGFEDYLEMIRTWASSELQFYIPLPNEIE